MSKKKTPKPVSEEPTVQLDPNSDLPPDADVEEKFNDFWKKNGLGVFGGIALGAVVVLGVQIFDYMGDNKEAAISEAFAEANTIEEKVSFIESNPDHILTGVALLTVADNSYREGEFAKAADGYANAKEILSGSALLNRAKLGHGISLIRSGQADGGRAVLEGLAADISVLDDIRGEAAYNLAVSRWEAGNLKGVKSALELIESLEGSPMWAARASNLEKSIPELMSADVEG